MSTNSLCQRSPGHQHTMPPVFGDVFWRNHSPLVQDSRVPVGPRQAFVEDEWTVGDAPHREVSFSRLALLVTVAAALVAVLLLRAGRLAPPGLVPLLVAAFLFAWLFPAAVQPLLWYVDLPISHIRHNHSCPQPDDLVSASGKVFPSGLIDPDLELESRNTIWSKYSLTTRPWPSCQEETLWNQRHVQQRTTTELLSERPFRSRFDSLESCTGATSHTNRLIDTESSERCGLRCYRRKFSAW